MITEHRIEYRVPGNPHWLYYDDPEVSYDPQGRLKIAVEKDSNLPWNKDIVEWRLVKVLTETVCTARRLE